MKRRTLLMAAGLAATCLSAGGLVALAANRAGEKPPMMLVHNVFFSLNESTLENRDKLVAACHKYLSGHPGTVFYCAGPVAAELDRSVNDRDWDVGLHLIFENMAAHDAYQVHPRHLAFIEENKATWKKVRVFDSHAAAAE